MSIIEEAAKRLDALKRSGVEMPWAESRVIDGRVSLRPGAPGLSSAEETGLNCAELPDSKVLSAVAAQGDQLRGRARRGRPNLNVVQLDLDRLGQEGYITSDTRADMAQLAAEYRILKRPLMKNVDTAAAGGAIKRANLIMVTSAVPAEGKTFTALNLALSIAMEVDRRVLLVDADVLRPSVLNRLGLPPARGLMDVLSDSSLDLSDVLVRTNLSKLSLLPSGSHRTNATELLASASMDQLLDEMGERYSDRIIIFDAPPLLPSPESRVLASRVGQVVMVVQQGSSTRDAVTQAFAAVQSCPVVMSILNKCRGMDQSELYGSYYGMLSAGG